MESGYDGSSSDNEDEVREMLSPPKAPNAVLKFKCPHCSAAFASRKEYKIHSEMHAQMPNPNPCKRTLSQREMAMHVNTNPSSGVLPPNPATMAMGPTNVMNQPSLNLNLPPSTKPKLISPCAVTLGTDAAALPFPPGFPPHPYQHREVETVYAKRPRNNNGQGDNKMNSGGTSGAGGSSSGNGGDNGESGGGSNGNNGGTIKPIHDFDLNLFPPEE